MFAAVAPPNAAAAQEVVANITSDVDFARDVRPLLEDCCIDCHGGADPKAKLSFEPFTDEASAARAVAVWMAARDKLRCDAMPPPEAPPPDAAQRASALRWLDARLGTGPGAWPIDPGRTTIRRLNRAEYANTVRDLFDTDFDVVPLLPPDESGYGFDNVADVLSVPPLLLERYVACAEVVAELALPSLQRRQSNQAPIAVVVEPRASAHRAKKEDERIIVETGGFVVALFNVPRNGEYFVRFTVFGNGDEEGSCAFAFGRSKRILGKAEVKYAANAPAACEARLQLTSGATQLMVHNMGEVSDAPGRMSRAGRPRTIGIEKVTIEGPVGGTTIEKSEQRFYVCHDDPNHGRACVPELLRNFATRAWRRPVTEAEVDRLVELFDGAVAAGDDFTAALRQGVVAVLSSPHFLFRIELDADANDPTLAHPLNDYELASRLSYFLWSSLPDERLEEAARSRQLSDPATLIAEAKRMLADARADSLVTQFADQWLDLRGLDGVEPDAKLFPYFDPPLREAMRQETELFVRSVFFDHLPLRNLLDADFTFVNERLARFYGIEEVKGPQMRRVVLTSPTRGGVMTQGSFLTLTSSPARTSPTKRGRMILDRFLGTPAKAPPPGVGVLDESSDAARKLPIGEKLARHRKDPSCAACHDQIDPLGLALEEFGPIGKTRPIDVQQIDASLRTLPDGTRFDGVASLKAMLLRHDSFTRCFGKKLFTFALGRGLSDDDRRAVDALVDSFQGRSPTFEELVVGLVQLDAFRRRRGEAANGDPDDR